MHRNKNQKGKLDSWDTLLFNTYYNSLIGNKGVDLNKLLGEEMMRFSTPSTCSTRNKLKFKRVQWADEEHPHKQRRTNSTETGDKEKFSRFAFKLASKFDWKPIIDVSR